MQVTADKHITQKKYMRNETDLGFIIHFNLEMLRFLDARVGMGKYEYMIDI